jgi:hypothetical protein
MEHEWVPETELTQPVTPGQLPVWFGQQDVIARHHGRSATRHGNLPIHRSLYHPSL